jgi:hypothetical protein
MIIAFLTRMLFAAYFLESGIILIVAPWSTFWDRNVFVEWLPALEHFLASPFSRGAISGIGAITAIAGIAELAAAFGARLQRNENPPASL